VKWAVSFQKVKLAPKVQTPDEKFEDFNAVVKRNAAALWQDPQCPPDYITFAYCYITAIDDNYYYLCSRERFLGRLNTRSVKCTQ